MHLGGSPTTTLRESCIRTLARCLHTVSTQRFVSIVWPEECLLELLQARGLMLSKCGELPAHHSHGDGAGC